MLDPNHYRPDSPACENKLFLNSAGSSLMPNIVVDKMQAYLSAEAQVGGYELADRESTDIRAAYSDIATMLNTQPHNIAITSSATDAYSRALHSIPLKAGDTIVTTDDDYISNHIAMISLERRIGIHIYRCANLNNGDLDMDDMEHLIKKHSPKLVTVTYVPSNSGLVQNAIGVGKLCDQYDIWYLVDGCQACGQLDVNVTELCCDFLSATARKFLRGPRGSGFLYVADKALTSGLSPSFIDMRGADLNQPQSYDLYPGAMRFEQWEQSYMSIIGLGAAVRYATQIGLSNIAVYNEKYAADFRERLAMLPGIEVLDKGSQQCAIITFTDRSRTMDQVVTHLKANNVYFGISMNKFAIIDAAKKGYEWSIRFSPHYFNTYGEMDQTISILTDLPS
jgi:cysteine desulfurase / selenocysteine lyase